tara:strand:+ start:109 stop:540 length:432 start_codon:yes stop_codon:yes gene_type:complete
MAKYYKDCGWLPFGWNKTEAEYVGKCGTSTELKDGKCEIMEDVGKCGTSSTDFCGVGTELKDGKCQLIVDATTVLQTTSEFCRENNWLSHPDPADYPEHIAQLCSALLPDGTQALNLDKCSSGFFTDDCRSELESLVESKLSG